MKVIKKLPTITNGYSTSKYWIDDYTYERLESTGTDIIALASFQKAIANFVRITTGVDIPVKYNTKDSSFTDGEVVVLSAKLDDKLFDCNVGLALHEGSHCLLTDFKALRRLVDGNHPKVHKFINAALEKHIGDAEQKLNASINWRERLKYILNIVEDRRIDNYVYNAAPGYRGYYLAMYEQYFNNKEVDAALIKNKMCTPDYDGYIFHLCNIMNPNRNLNALPKLQKLWDTLDLYNISRIQSTEDAIDITLQLASIIEDELLYIDEDTTPGMNPNSSTEDPEQEENDPGQSEDGSDISESDESKDGSGDGAADNGNPLDRVDVSPQRSQSAKQKSKVSTTDKKEEKKLQDAIQKQKDFLDGDVNKKSVNKKEFQQLDTINSGDVSVENVFDKKTDCIVINRITEATMSMFPNIFTYDYTAFKKSGGVYNPDGKSRAQRNFNAVTEGIMLGAMLGRKLKLRNEDNSLSTTRLRDGKIDRRLIADLGYGAEAVFSKIVHKTVNPVFIHYSIDASGSMSGTAFYNALKSAAAIAKAASMIKGVNVQISFRITTELNGQVKPAIVIGYDSKKNTLQHLTSKMYLVDANGSTPEGLCFEAIYKTMTTALKRNVDGIFINISDGEPAFGGRGVSYSGNMALEHTRTQVERFRNAGYKILSYFVCSDTYWNARIKRDFIHMYGKDSQFIDPVNLNDLAKSLNSTLLAPVYGN
jgi:hypothetical protein